MAANRKIRLLLADDHSLVREGIRSSLVRYPAISVVGEAATGREAISKSRQLAPDIVLMDLNMPEMSGLEATPIIRKHCPDTKVIALTVHDSKEYVYQILRTGAQGYVLKDTSPEELVRAIKAVAAGQAFFSPSVSKLLLQEVVQAPEKPVARKEKLLSEREKEVLQAIAQGLTSKEVASRHNLSVRTVETYRVRIKRKLKARNVAELLKIARDQKLL
jgi:DNA-binding NarL/FixJ family response regulator